MSWEIPQKVELGRKLIQLTPMAQGFFWEIWEGLDERSRENKVSLDLERMRGERKHVQPIHNALRELEDANLLTRPAGVGNQWGTVIVNPYYLHAFVLNDAKGELKERQASYDREREVRSERARAKALAKGTEGHV